MLTSGASHLIAQIRKLTGLLPEKNREAVKRVCYVIFETMEFKEEFLAVSLK